MVYERSLFQKINGAKGEFVHWRPKELAPDGVTANIPEGFRDFLEKEVQDIRSIGKAIKAFHVLVAAFSAPDELAIIPIRQDFFEGDNAGKLHPSEQLTREKLPPLSSKEFNESGITYVNAPVAHAAVGRRLNQAATEMPLENNLLVVDLTMLQALANPELRRVRRIDEAEIKRRMVLSLSAVPHISLGDTLAISYATLATVAMAAVIQKNRQK